ncbi:MULTISPECIES: FecCD family ABC transporter permease [Chelativorans]|jgi:iron complex transport system permease protein|uniref:Transport system permease protein n=1 Tax=Chelativorans sp. (strain BNC1) TaxID=266779 RepID=Q11M35_CHESB|nr:MULTISPECIES: iron ABC transporter permease [Chelativorans]
MMGEAAKLSRSGPALGGIARDRARAVTVLLILLIVTLLVVLASTAFGSTWVPLEKIVAVLTGGGERTERLIVLQLRLPRVLLAALAGGAMAVAGFLLQKVTRNDLASPSVLGVVDGAALGVVIFLALLSDESNALIVSIAWQPLAAVLGACAAVALVFALSGRQASSAVRLLLFGIAAAAAAKSVIMVLLLTGPIYRTTQATRWIAGAVNETNWGEVQMTAELLLPVLLLALLAARRLPPSDLDDVSAQSVGLNLPVFRLAVFALAAALTSVSVAFAGGVSFIGLLAPHIARLLIGRSAVAGMLASALCGAVILMGADLVVRVLFAPTEVPAGAITAVIGAPYFLYLLLRKDRLNG